MIKQFTDEYAWLSNFKLFEKPFLHDGIEYKSNEHFYQAMKTTNKEIRKTISEHPGKGLKAFARSITLRPGWDSLKDDIMEIGLRYKFSEANPTLRELLIATKNQHIMEGNWWNDTYWGVDLKTNNGRNKLGELLMKIRAELLIPTIKG
jgi:ribA/ribD-fused uncharacterized protein